MLIKESVLRKIIREEIVKEAINKDILSEAFLQDLGRKLGKKGNALLLFLASQAATLNNAEARPLDGHDDGGLAAATKMVKKQEEDLKKYKKYFKAQSVRLDASEQSTQEAMKKINDNLEEIRKKAEEYKKNPFLILKGLKRVDTGNNKQVFALLNYKKTVAALTGKYAVLISQGKLSSSDVEKVGIYIKYISDSAFKGKFPNPTAMIEYMKGQIGQ